MSLKRHRQYRYRNRHVVHFEDRRVNCKVHGEPAEFIPVADELTRFCEAEQWTADLSDGSMNFQVNAQIRNC